MPARSFIPRASSPPRRRCAWAWSTRWCRRASSRAIVKNYCALIAANAPLTVRAAKVAIREALKDESARDLDLCKRLVDECFASADYAEGRTAFMEKRQPAFTGR